jgi:hypothetical protein
MKNFEKSPNNKLEDSQKMFRKFMITGLAAISTILPMTQKPVHAQGFDDYRSVTENVNTPKTSESGQQKIFDKFFGSTGSNVIINHYSEDPSMSISEYLNSPRLIVPTGITPQQYKMMLQAKIAEVSGTMEDGKVGLIFVIFPNLGKADGVEINKLIDGTVRAIPFSKKFPGVIH